MKKLFIGTMLILLLIASVSVSFAQDVVLTWDTAPASENVDLYQVEMDGQVIADIVPNTFSVVSLADGSHTARVRAHNVWGWSAFSAPFVFTKGVPGTAVNIRLEVSP